MSSLYQKDKDIAVIRRASGNKEFEEYPLIVNPLSALVTDPANNVVCTPLSGLSIGFSNSSSFAQTALDALSASFALSASYVIWSGNSISASYAITASYVLTASFAEEVSSALNAVSASYSITSSFALNAGGINNLDGGMSNSIYGGTTAIDGGIS